MIKAIKFLLLFLWIALLLGFITLQFFTTFQPALLEAFIYWWVLIFWIFIIWQFKVQTKVSFYIVASLLSLSALILIVGFFDIGERIARLAFIGWIVGLCQAFLDYKRTSKA